jgi:hypothetical protein
MANMDDRLIVRREKAPLPLPAWLTCERLTVRPAGVREQDSRKRFQSDVWKA